jgi:hypothetical protein
MPSLRRFYFRDAFFAAKNLSALWPSANGVVGEGRCKQALNPSFMIRLFHGVINLQSSLESQPPVAP